MSSMTQKANSDCSYPESDYDDFKSQISQVHERLIAVLHKEAELRRTLEELFNKQEAEALEELKKAEQNLKSIREERAVMKSQLKDKGSQIESQKMVQDSAQEAKPQTIPLEPSPVPTALIGNQHSTSDQEQNYPSTFDSPETHALSLKYQGNKAALELVVQMREYEHQAENFRKNVEETETLGRLWEKIRDKSSGKTWSFANDKYNATNYWRHKSDMDQAESNVAMIRDILTNFE